MTCVRNKWRCWAWCYSAPTSSLFTPRCRYRLQVTSTRRSLRITLVSTPGDRQTVTGKGRHYRGLVLSLPYRFISPPATTIICPVPSPSAHQHNILAGLGLWDVTDEPETRAGPRGGDYAAKDSSLVIRCPIVWLLSAGDTWSDVAPTRATRHVWRRADLSTRQASADSELCRIKCSNFITDKSHTIRTDSW